MRAKIEADSEAAEKAVRDIRRATRRHFAAEDKVRIVIAGLRGEDSVAELCRKERINQNLYYRWSRSSSSKIGPYCPLRKRQAFLIEPHIGPCLLPNSSGLSKSTPLRK